MSRRFKSSTFKFRQPLATPQSKRVFHCYATHGKGYGHSPPIGGADIRILLVNAAREVLWADARYDGRELLLRGREERRPMVPARLGHG